MDTFLAIPKKKRNKFLLLLGFSHMTPDNEDIEIFSLFFVVVVKKSFRLRLFRFDRKMIGNVQ